MPAVAKFFVNLPDMLGDLGGKGPRRISFIDQGRFVLVYPFRIFVIVLLIKKSVVSPETLSTIERLIERYGA